MSLIFTVLKKEFLSIIALIISLISLFYVIKQDIEQSQKVHTENLVEVVKTLSTIKEHINELKACLPSQSCSQFYMTLGVENFEQYLSLVSDNIDIHRKKIGDNFEIKAVKNAIETYSNRAGHDDFALLEKLYPKVHYVQKNILNEMKK